MFTKFLSLFLLAAIAALGTRCGFAQQQKLSEMIHTAWTARDGAPQDILALAQDHNGSLWIGTAGGLFNFDGLTFKLFVPPPGEPALPSTSILSLLVAADGALWVGFDEGGAVRIVDGHIANVFIGKKLGNIQYALANVSNLMQSPRPGRIFGSGNRMSWYIFDSDGSLTRSAGPPAAPGTPIRSFFLDMSSNLWAAELGALWKQTVGHTEWAPTEAKGDDVVCHQELADGSIWMADFDRTADKPRRQHFDKSGKLLSARYDTFGVLGCMPLPGGDMLASHSTGLSIEHWLDGPKGVSADLDPQEDTFNRQAGLTANGSRSMLRDKDGNLWVGTVRGLDRFKPARLVRSVGGAVEGAWYVCATPSGAVWIENGDRKNLYSVSGDRTAKVVEKNTLRKIQCGQDDDVWSINSGELLDIRPDRTERVKLLPGYMNFNLRALAWLDPKTLVAGGTGAVGPSGEFQSGLATLRDHRWSHLEAEGELPPAVGAMLADKHGRFWLVFQQKVYVLEHGRSSVRFTVPRAFGWLHLLYESSYGMFIAGSNDVALVRDSGLRTLHLANPELGGGVTGVVESRNHDIWLNGARGIVRIAADEVNAALQDERHQIVAENIVEGDFVGPASPADLNPSAAIDTTGKLWFATLSGVVSYDPQRKLPPLPMPILGIRSVTGDGRPLAQDGVFSPGLRTLNIRYQAVDLTWPEKVTYRYRLDGADTSWQDVGSRGEAIYTSLSPGSYVFRVMASNGEGVWTQQVTRAFRVLPRFYQTWWFRLLLVLLVFVLLWLLVMVRLRYAARAIRRRAEERADERIRIARELHDTLLQGVQGLMMNFHVAAQKVSPDDQSRAMLDRALSSADRLIVEGRSRVASLRAGHLTDVDLVVSIEAIGRDLATDDRISYVVQTRGEAKELRPECADEIYLIGREAITNAFRHAHASAIEVTLNYERDQFIFSCRDDGRGFAVDTSLRSLDGHWGLRGMTERAERIGGRFECNTAPAQGTEIAVTLPSSRAYKERRSFSSFLERFRFGKLDI